MIDRRGFLETLGALALAGVSTGASRCSSATPGRIQRIGLQLYTVRGEMAKDFEGTLARVAAVGYDEVEFAGYFDRPPAEVRSVLQRLGLAAPSAHVPIERVRDDWAHALEAASVIGHQYLVVPWLAPEQRRTIDDYRRVAALLNQAAVQAREAGIRLAYHNHEFEFETIDGRVPYDVLLAETDPSLVPMELDLYWIVKAGADPFEYFERYPGRFQMVHVKDADGSAERRMVDVGEGVIDWPGIFARRDQAGIRHFFVEHDNPSDPFASIRASHEYLSRLELR